MGALIGPLKAAVAKSQQLHGGIQPPPPRRPVTSVTPWIPTDVTLTLAKVAKTTTAPTLKAKAS